MKERHAQNPFLFFQVAERKITQLGNRKLFKLLLFLFLGALVFPTSLHPGTSKLLPFGAATTNQRKGLYRVECGQHRSQVSGESSRLFQY